MKKGLRWLLASLIALPLLLLLGVFSILGSTAGSQWLLAQVPGLSTEGFSGQLLGNWRSTRLQWTDGSTTVDLQQLEVAFRPGCLSDLRICLPLLAVEKLDLKLTPSSEPASSEPVVLPDVQLPVSAVIDELRLGELVLDGQMLVKDLKLAARLDEQGLQISDLALADSVAAGWSGSISRFSLGLSGDWPLAASITLQGAAPDNGEAWPLTAEIQGALQRQLQIELRSEGWLEGQIQAQLTPLASELPLALDAELLARRLPQGVPPSLQPGRLKLQVAGDLQQGLAIKARTTLGDAYGMPLALDALVSALDLKLERLSLQDGEGGELLASGTVGWDGPLAVDLQLASGAFAWQRLHPAIPVELGLRGLKLDTRLREQDYDGQLQVDLATPAGDGRLSTPFKGDFGQIRLPELRWQQDNSSLLGDIRADFNSLAWQADLKASNFDPSAWVAEVPGRIGGDINARGNDRSASASWQLGGQLRQQKLAASGQLDWAGERVDVPELELQLGANRIAGNLRIDQQLAADLDIALSRLDQLWPGLRGKLQGGLQLAGSLKAPEGRLKLAGNASYQDYQIGQLSLDSQIDGEQNGQLALQASDLRLAGQRWHNLQVTASGNPQNQQAAIAGRGRDEERIALKVAGGFAGNDWQGSLQDGRIALAGFDWRQLSAAALGYRADGRIELGSHCWGMDKARLCAGEQQLAPVQKLDLKLSGLPLDRLPGELPENVRIQGEVNAAVQLLVAGDGPRGQLWLDAGEGSILLPSGSDATPLPLDWQQLRVDSQLQPQLIDSKVRIAGPQIGSLSVDVALDPRNQQLNGHYDFNALKLALLQPLLGEGMTLDGQLGGKGRLMGNLQQPRVEGNVALTQGKVAGDAMPLSIEDLQLALNIQGERAELDGGWVSGEQGKGRIAGQLQWAPQPVVDIRIQGQRLPVNVAPYAELDVEPDLQLALRDDKLRLSGEVAIPRGAIEVRQLPESAVGLSPDVRVVGEDEEAASLPLRADIRLRIGEDKLTFKGFGLSALLRGDLRVNEKQEARGSLQLDEGRYKAYGQDLTLRRAQILFAGALERPQLDIEAVRRFSGEDLIAGIRLSGPADAPQTEVFSEPGMSQEETLSWLVLGRAPGTESEDQDVLSSAALALGLAGGAPVAKGLADRLGIQDFQLESSGSGLSTSVVASGYLTSKLSLRYGVGVFEQGNTLALRYELSRRLYLEAASGVASSLDLFYKKDY